MASGNDPFDGLDDVLQRDAERFRRLNQKGVRDLSPPAVIEYVLWSLCVVSIVAMVGSMLWVGPNKPIPGHVWLGYSLIGILLFGGLAFLIRWLRSVAPAADRVATARFEGGR